MNLFPENNSSTKFTESENRYNFPHHVYIPTSERTWLFEGSHSVTVVTLKYWICEGQCVKTHQLQQCDFTTSYRSASLHTMDQGLPFPTGL